MSGILSWYHKLILLHSYYIHIKEPSQTPPALLPKSTHILQTSEILLKVHFCQHSPAPILAAFITVMPIFSFISLTDLQKADVENRERANPKTLRHLGTGMPFMALHRIRHVKKSPRLFLSMATIFRPMGFHFHHIVWPDERKFPKACRLADYSSSQWIRNKWTTVLTPILEVKSFIPEESIVFQSCSCPVSTFYQQPLGASDPLV